MTRQIRVLIVDDQPRARQSLRALLATWPNIQDIREAVNGRQAIKAVVESAPDVVLMDARMPVMDGLEATRLIKNFFPDVRVIVLSMYPETENQARESGADAFVYKCEPPDRLIAALAEAGISSEQA